MAKLFIYSLIGLIGGLLIGPPFAWWVIRPHDSFAGGGYAAMFAIPIGGAAGLLTGLGYSAFHLRKHGKESWPSLATFSIVLLLSIIGSIVLIFSILGTPISYFWEAFLPKH